MAQSDYGPGRRRKPMVSFVLDWAAGVLIAILLIMLGAGVVSLVVAPGLDRLGAMVTMSIAVWPIGAALGVWLSMGQPRRARELAAGLGLTLLGAGVLMLPVWLDLESDVVRGVAGIVALIAAPALARVGVGFARRE